MFLLLLISSCKLLTCDSLIVESGATLRLQEPAKKIAHIKANDIPLLIATLLKTLKIKLNNVPSSNIVCNLNRSAPDRRYSRRLIITIPSLAPSGQFQIAVKKPTT